MIFSDEQRFEGHPDAVARVLEGEMVMLDLNTGMYFGMNEVGARVWQLLSEGMTLSEIIATLLGEFAVEESTLRDDVSTLLRELIERQLLRPVEP